jgi:iron transport multicopper oxidase
MSFY